MEGGALFNPGFLGGNFLWWIGQIADDSTWRDNIIPGKFEKNDTGEGWGYRYKVRIIGLHDQEEESLKSEELPWAQVMYPITAGGGQTNSSQTPNLRQGMFVFGFFLDGQDQQVPVIMGVLGNNAKTTLANKTGLTGGKNYTPQRGTAPTKVPKTGSAQEKVPDEGKSAPNVPASSAPISNPTKENADAVHLLSASDVKREDKYQEKIPLMKPDDKIGSAIKCIQIVIDNLTKKIDKYLKAITSYIDAVSSTISDLASLISKAACEIAKYLKIIFDKIMEYVIKLLNKELTKVVSAMPSSKRHMFADIKEILIELLYCLYNKITAGLCGLTDGLLNQVIKPDQIEEEARAAASLANTTSGDSVTRATRPSAPICYAETLVAQVIAFNKDEIDDANNTIFNNLNKFIDDMQSEIAGVGGASTSNISSLLGNINGNMSAALSFNNLCLNIFGCDLKPNAAVSDYYTFARGGASQSDAQIPSINDVAAAISKGVNISAPTEIPFADIPASTPDVKFLRGG